MGLSGVGKIFFIKCMIENFKDIFNIVVIEGDVVLIIDV